MAILLQWPCGSTGFRRLPPIIIVTEFYGLRRLGAHQSKMNTHEHHWYVANLDGRLALHVEPVCDNLFWGSRPPTCCVVNMFASRPHTNFGTSWEYEVTRGPSIFGYVGCPTLIISGHCGCPTLVSCVLPWDIFFLGSRLSTLSGYHFDVRTEARKRAQIRIICRRCWFHEVC